MTCGPHRLDLGDQPGPARDHLGAAGFLVDASFAALAGELEVLDRVGLIDQRRVDAGVLEGAGEQATGRADERLAGAVLLVAGLLAHQHDRRSGVPIAEHRLGGVFEKRTAVACFGRIAQRVEVPLLRKVAGGPGCVRCCGHG